MDKGDPFAAQVGKLSDEQMMSVAKKDCDHCHGTGREGFIEGVAVVCRCVKPRIFEIQTTTPGKYDALREALEKGKL